MRTDIDFCFGTNAKICKKCKRLVAKSGNKSIDDWKLFWRIQPREKDEKCELFRSLT